MRRSGCSRWAEYAPTHRRLGFAPCPSPVGTRSTTHGSTLGTSTGRPKGPGRNRTDSHPVEQAMSKIDSLHPNIREFAEGLIKKVRDPTIAKCDAIAEGKVRVARWEK